MPGPRFRGGSVTGNNKVWRKFTFTPITTTKIRVLTNASTDGYSRIAEREAWQNAPVNVALAANGGVASASSDYVCCGWNFTPAGANKATAVAQDGAPVKLE